MRALSVSAIVPTLNEENLVGPLVRRLLEIGASEVIVADGRSQDRTWERAAEAGAALLACEPGRGAQMAAGAALASGEVLWFVHADTAPPADAIDLIRAALSRSNVVAGAFRLRFDHPHPLLALYSYCSRINRPFATYGDQTLFVRASVYRKIGGHKPLALLEDLEIQRRLRPLGRFVKLKRSVKTSARRFLSDGILRRQMQNALLLAAFHLGVCPSRLQRFYQRRDDLRPH